MNTKRISVTLACGALTLGAGALRSANAAGEGPHSISANIGVVSDYLWRGQTQTDHQPAVQGGLDYAHESGFYAGTWLSNVDFGSDDDTSYELDLYTGFGGSINDDLSYDINLIYYAYPDARDTDFSELGASLTYKWLTAGLAYTIYGQADNDSVFIEGDLYYHAALDFELPYALALNLHGGYYDFKNNGGTDYAHWGVSISREAGDFGTVSLNYDQIGRDTYDDDPRVWIGWNKEF